ncbi:MAG: hypothetical protein NT011_07340 [Kiritimatiellaeota bacterium]|nr:hypothetical protein [Kiritimatiellota bacterium]
MKIDSRKQLFIDEKFIENKKGITLQVNPPVKAEQIECLTPAYHPPYVIEYGGKYFMYYGSKKDGIVVYTSTDGVTWKNGVTDPSGNPRAIASYGEGGPFLDPRAEDGYPFKSISGVGNDPVKGLVGVWAETVGTNGGKILEGALYLFRSKNGLQWEIVPKIPVPFTCDTANQCVYDPGIGRYVAYLRGEKNGRAVARTEIDDLMKMPWPFRRNASRPTGPHGCYSGIKEDEMDIVLFSDDQDPPGTDIYNPCVNIYPHAQDVYLAFPSMFRAYGYGDRKYLDATYGRENRRDIRGDESGDGLFEIQLAVSRDGKQFQRFRTPYLRPGLVTDRRGERGEKDCGLIMLGIGMVRQGDYLCQYYLGMQGTHCDFPVVARRGIDPAKDRRIFRLIQRLDGFVSADAGAEGGEITTPVLTFAGNRLVLNADCGGLGEIWVELQDGQGMPVSGYALADSVSIDRNGTAQEIWWKQGPDVSKLAGKPIRLHIKMRSAKLFAFQFINA